MVLIGFHQGSIPLPRREDGWLTDSLCALLNRQQVTVTPLPTRESERLDEHLLLQLALRTPIEEIAVLRQRADAGGSALAESPARQELEQFWGRALPELEDAPGDAATSAHRRATGARAGDRGFRFSRRSGVRGPAMPARAPRTAACWPVRCASAAAVLGRAPEWIATVDSPDPGALAFDGMVPSEGRLLGLRGRVTRLEAYGRKPLAHFFRSVLGVEQREGVRQPGPLHHELGSAVHDVLEACWKEAAERRCAAPVEHLDAAFTQFVEPLFRTAGGPPGHGPYLSHERTRWHDALTRFLEWDTRRLAEGWNKRDGHLGGGPMQVEARSVEVDLEQDLCFGEQELRLRGRIDRLLRSEDGGRVSDYKTGSIADVSSPKGMLTADRIQTALYLLLVERAREEPELAASLPAACEAEALRVHPDCDWSESTASKGGFASGIRADKWSALRPHVLETLEVLVHHLRAGHFPATLSPQDEPGDRAPWDGWFATMRLGHAPTLRRLAAHEPWHGLYALRAKSPGKPRNWPTPVLTQAEALERFEAQR